MSIGAADVAVPAVDGGVARRTKALACTAPLHDLDARKGRLEWDATAYQMGEIGLQAIDQVTLAMDFDHGADHDEVVRRLLPFVAAQSPAAGRDEHARVAHWVIDNLVNVGSIDRGFAVEYGGTDADGRYVRRRFDFKLLVEVAAPDGGVYLRVSDEAINVLVGALDTDVESAQEAAETKLENLIARGRLGDARLAAEQARYRTVQYAESLRRKLEATRRDVRSVDWLEQVPQLLDEALTHIEGRYRAETAIKANIADARDEAVEPDRRRQAAELVVLVDDCIQRHTQLQARLQEAGAAFRAEQDRQQFSGRPRRAAVDVFGQLLRPALGLTVADAAGPVQAFFAAGTGAGAPPVPGLGGLVETLLTPPADRDPFGAEVPEPELAPQPPERFGERAWAATDAVLPGGAGGPSGPVRLSTALARARASGEDVAQLVALRAVHAVGTAIGTARTQGDPTVLIAVDDGTVLHDPCYGGADLLLAPAQVQEAPR